MLINTKVNGILTYIKTTASINIDSRPPKAVAYRRDGSAICGDP